MNTVWWAFLLLVLYVQRQAAARRLGALARCQAIAVEAPPQLNIANDVSELIGAYMGLFGLQMVLTVQCLYFSDNALTTQLSHHATAP